MVIRYTLFVDGMLPINYSGNLMVGVGGSLLWMERGTESEIGEGEREVQREKVKERE